MRVSRRPFSMNERTSKRLSITVTCDPKDENIVAISIPITPPPITARLFGMEEISRIPVLSNTFLLSIPLIGTTLLVDPEARIV